MHEYSGYLYSRYKIFNANLARCPIQNFSDEFVDRAGGVGVEFVRGSVG